MALYYTHLGFSYAIVLNSASYGTIVLSRSISLCFCSIGGNLEINTIILNLTQNFHSNNLKVLNENDFP